jgi:hypothetical protein
LVTQPNVQPDDSSGAIQGIAWSNDDNMSQIRS